MRVDVIIPTYNRQDMLRLTLASLRDAQVPAEMELQLVVVDNNSTDQTRQVVESEIPHWQGRLQYTFEPQQGKSFALNRAIQMTDGEIVAMVDDDEEIHSDWFRCIAQVFADPTIDYIGGPCRPLWKGATPAWLPKGYRAVLGWVEGGEAIKEFGKDYQGILMGGNSVVRRHVFARVGHYATELGRNGYSLLGGEDQDFYERLVVSGLRGQYRPDLVVYFHVLPERLTKRYYRRWTFWNAVSLGMIDRERRKNMPYLFGMPRYMHVKAAQGVGKFLQTPFVSAEKASEVFTSELAFWDWAGFYYGKYWYRTGR